MTDRGSEEREGPEDRSPDPSDQLNGKPVLKWTKEDWRRWIDGSTDNSPTGASPTGASPTGAIPTGAIPTGAESPARPTPDLTLAEPKIEVQPEVTVAEADVTAADVEVKPDAIRLSPRRPILFDIESNTAPPAVQARTPSPPETELPQLSPELPQPSPEPSPPGAAEQKAPSPTAERKSKAAPRSKPKPRVDLEGRIGSAMGLFVLSVLMGALLAGLITAALVVIGMALRGVVT